MPEDLPPQSPPAQLEPVTFKPVQFELAHNNAPLTNRQINVVIALAGLVHDNKAEVDRIAEQARRGSILHTVATLGSIVVDQIHVQSHQENRIDRVNHSLGFLGGVEPSDANYKTTFDQMRSAADIYLSPGEIDRLLRTGQAAWPLNHRIEQCLDETLAQPPMYEDTSKRISFRKKPKRTIIPLSIPAEPAESDREPMPLPVIQIPRLGRPDRPVAPAARSEPAGPTPEEIDAAAGLMPIPSQMRDDISGIAPFEILAENDPGRQLLYLAGDYETPIKLLPANFMSLVSGLIEHGYPRDVADDYLIEYAQQAELPAGSPAEALRAIAAILDEHIAQAIANSKAGRRLYTGVIMRGARLFLRLIDRDITSQQVWLLGDIQQKINPTRYISDTTAYLKSVGRLEAVRNRLQDPDRLQEPLFAEMRTELSRKPASRSGRPRQQPTGSITGSGRSDSIGDGRSDRNLPSGVHAAPARLIPPVKPILPPRSMTPRPEMATAEAAVPDEIRHAVEAVVAVTYMSSTEQEGLLRWFISPAGALPDTAARNALYWLEDLYNDRRHDARLTYVERIVLSRFLAIGVWADEDPRTPAQITADLAESANPDQPEPLSTLLYALHKLISAPYNP